MARPPHLQGGLAPQQAGTSKVPFWLSTASWFGLVWFGLYAKTTYNAKVLGWSQPISRLQFEVPRPPGLGWSQHREGLLPTGLPSSCFYKCHISFHLKSVITGFITVLQFFCPQTSFSAWGLRNATVTHTAHYTVHCILEHCKLYTTLYCILYTQVM